MMNVFRKFQERKWEFILLFTIIAIGMFLRTYNFHEWLHFGSDQARDAILVDRVLNGTTPWPLLGADASNTHFKLGPIYYYFQIVSAKIFGSDVSVLAYPDVLFSILAIPLFYFLLRKYFEKHLSLIMTGLYASSFYIIEYSRFAWNPNPIPFFVMLFLFALMELFAAREKTSLLWIAALGVALGVSIQLHTLLLLILPVIFFSASVFLLGKNRGIWVKIILIVVIALILNFGQIKGEIETHGANSQLFLKAFTDRSQSGTGRFAASFEADLLSHAQANTHILSSLGDRGVFTFLSILSHPSRTDSRILYAVYVCGVMISIAFSLLGYGLLIRNALQEKDSGKKIFLGLMLTYAVLSFLVLFSVARGMPLRYFIHTTFVPFILLGLIIDWIRLTMPRQSAAVAVVIFLFCFSANASAIAAEASDLAHGSRGDRGFVVLGEAKQMVDHMIVQAAAAKDAYLFGGTEYVATYFKPLQYIAEKKGFRLERVKRKKAPLSDKPYFFIQKSSGVRESFEMSQFETIGNKDFGRIGIYQLRKQ
ncbi:MAG: glycosyltransferase family 39 protein [Candidatus Moraniibacteriota bacterium]